MFYYVSHLSFIVLILLGSSGKLDIQGALGESKVRSLWTLEAVESFCSMEQLWYGKWWPEEKGLFLVLKIETWKGSLIQRWICDSVSWNLIESTKPCVIEGRNYSLPTHGLGQSIHRCVYWCVVNNNSSVLCWAHTMCQSLALSWGTYSIIWIYIFTQSSLQPHEASVSINSHLTEEKADM